MEEKKMLVVENVDGAVDLSGLLGTDAFFSDMILSFIRTKKMNQEGSYEKCHHLCPSLNEKAGGK